jgi:hypothetical protein
VQQQVPIYDVDQRLDRRIRASALTWAMQFPTAPTCTAML